MESGLAQMNRMDMMIGQLAAGRIPAGMSLLDFMPAKVRNNLPADAKKTMKNIHSTADINKAVRELNKAEADMRRSIKEMEAERREMADAMKEMKETASKLDAMKFKLGKLRDAVPGAFDEAADGYLISIGERDKAIEKIFQRTLNEGFKKIYLMVAVISAFAILLLMGYSTRREKEREEM